jgi:SAM-dependent methyltransferase
MTEWTDTRKDAAAGLLRLIQFRLLSEATYVVASLEIADLLADSPKTAEQLAAATGADALSLRRVMHALSSVGVFSEDSAGNFALTPMGDFLKRNTEGSLYPAAMFFGGENAGKMVALLAESVRTGKSAGEILFGGDWTTWLQHDPRHVELFNSMMTSYSTLQLTGVLEAYDFSPFKRIVDVGGGLGKVISEILKRNPAMQGVLFDMPHAFEGGKDAIAQAGLANRCEVVAGDFFTSAPAGGDLYCISRVIHDWDDENSIAILKNVRKAIAPDGRLVLLEGMLRPSGHPYLILSDLNMLVRTGGRERTESEYRSLYKAAGFELTRAISTTSPLGTTVIEGKPI